MSLLHSSQSAEKRPTGSVFTCSKTSLPLSLPLNEIEIVFTLLFFVTCSFPVGYKHGGEGERGGAGTLTCISLKAEKDPIHQGDSDDKHIYTVETVGFFSSPPDLSLQLCPFLSHYIHFHDKCSLVTVTVYHSF